MTTSEEHFGLIGPLHTSGARVVVVEPDADAIPAAVTPRTKLLALSQVLWTSGRVLPVRELREQTGVPVLVDGAQSVGAIPVDAAGLDFLTVSGQKWLCGPDSTGALVVADPERLRVARPSYFSQTAHEPSGSFEPAAGAARFDPGWLSSAVLAGLLAALEVRPDWAYERAAARPRAAESCSRRWPRSSRETRRSSPSAPRIRPALVARLAEQGVVVREIPKTGLVRVSCGWWTTRPTCSGCVGALLGRVGGGAQAELLRDRLQRGDDVRDVLVQLEPEQLRAGIDLVAVDACREGRLLQLLLHRLRLEPVEPRRPDEPARMHEAGELVAGEERLLQHRVARQLEMLGVGEDGLDHLFRIPLLAQDRCAILRVLVERGVDLVVEIVQEPDDAPELLVLTEPAGIRPCRRLDRERMA